MDIVPVYYRNDQGTTIKRCEVEEINDVSRVIVDEFEKRNILDVEDDGTVSCRSCEGDCGHEHRVRERLRSITDGDVDVEEETGEGTDEETVRMTADD